MIIALSPGGGAEAPDTPPQLGGAHKVKGAMPWWTEDEERALLEGVERHGTGDQSWEKIKTDDDFSELLILRSCSSLRQKWRKDETKKSPYRPPPERRRALTGPCDHCGACESCQWRGGPPEKPKLCNACGIRLRNHNSLELPSRKNAWTEDEERALREGVERHGSGRWEHIKTDNDFSEILSLRSNHALYDRWRNVLVARGELKWGSKKRRKQRQREGGSPSSGGGAEAPHTPPQLGGGSRVQIGGHADHGGPGPRGGNRNGAIVGEPNHDAERC